MNSIYRKETKREVKNILKDISSVLNGNLIHEKRISGLYNLMKDEKFKLKNKVSKFEVLLKELLLVDEEIFKQFIDDIDINKVAMYNSSSDLSNLKVLKALARTESLPVYFGKGDKEFKDRLLSLNNVLSNLNVSLVTLDRDFNILNHTLHKGYNSLTNISKFLKDSKVYRENLCVRDTSIKVICSVLKGYSNTNNKNAKIDLSNHEFEINNSFSSINTLYDLHIMHHFITDDISSPSYNLSKEAITSTRDTLYEMILSNDSENSTIGLKYIDIIEESKSLDDITYGIYMNKQINKLDIDEANKTIQTLFYKNISLEEFDNLKIYLSLNQLLEIMTPI